MVALPPTEPPATPLGGGSGPARLSHPLLIAAPVLGARGTHEAYGVKGDYALELALVGLAARLIGSALALPRLEWAHEPEVDRGRRRAGYGATAPARQ
jgi:hypothetical protein